MNRLLTSGRARLLVGCRLVGDGARDPPHEKHLHKTVYDRTGAATTLLVIISASPPFPSPGHGRAGVSPVTAPHRFPCRFSVVLLYCIGVPRAVLPGFRTPLPCLIRRQSRAMAVGAVSAPCSAGHCRAYCDAMGPSGPWSPPRAGNLRACFLVPLCHRADDFRRFRSL